MLGDSMWLSEEAQRNLPTYPRTIFTIYAQQKNPFRRIYFSRPKAKESCEKFKRTLLAVTCHSYPRVLLLVFIPPLSRFLNKHLEYGQHFNLQRRTHFRWRFTAAQYTIQETCCPLRLHIFSWRAGGTLKCLALKFGKFMSRNNQARVCNFRISRSRSTL